MNSNHPALISGGLFFVIGLALAAALYGALAALLAQRSERLLLDD